MDSCEPSRYATKSSFSGNFFCLRDFPSGVTCSADAMQDTFRRFTPCVAAALKSFDLKSGCALQKENAVQGQENKKEYGVGHIVET